MSDDRMREDYNRETLRSRRKEIEYIPSDQPTGFTDEIIGYTRDELRRYAQDVKDHHNPAEQQGNNYNRCGLCYFARHPCDTYEMASAVLALLDTIRHDQIGLR